MLKTFRRFAAVALLVAGWAGVAEAALKAAGPVDPVTTLPAWYQDLNGLALQPCVDQNGFCILTPLFDPAFTNPPNTITTTGPINDNNFPDESFYFIADAVILNVGRGDGRGKFDKATLRLAMEAAFLSGVEPNGGITFLRAQTNNLSFLAPNSTYTVTHPYGTMTFTTDATGASPKGSGMAVRLEDMTGAGVFFPPDVRDAKHTHIGPWLVAEGGVVTDVATGNTYIGDPRTPTRVVNGTNGNIFRIDGPDIGGPGVNSVQTDLFTLSGKVFTGKIPLFLNVDRVSYARGANGGHVDAFVTGTSGALLDLSGLGLATARMTPTPTAPNDRFFASVAFGQTLPTSVKITNKSDLPTPTDYLVQLVDEVKVTQADYDAAAKTLTVKAASLDTVVVPTLTVRNVPVPVQLDSTGTAVVALGTEIPPMVVEVESSNGGLGTAPVSVVSAATGPLNQAPTASADTANVLSNTPTVIDVLANDTDPEGSPLTIVAVTQPAHGVVTNNAGGTVTYTPTPASYTGGDSFTYTIADGQGGNATAGVSVTVAAAPNVAPVANPDVATTGFNLPITIAVLANDSDQNGDPLIVSAVSAPTSGAAGINNGTTVTYVPQPGFSGVATFTYTVSDGRGGQTLGNVTVTVRPAETLNVTQALFIRPTEWRVSGTSTVEGATVTIYAGPDLSGTVIGTATVTAGAWTFRNRTSTVPQNTRLSVKSSGGATRLNQTVTIK